MAVTRGDFSDLLAPGAKKVYVDEYQQLPAVYPSIFTVDTSGRAFEDDLVMTGLPIAVSKPEGEEIAFDRPKFRGRVRYTHAGYGLAYEITREAVEDDLYGALTRQGSINLAWSMRAAEEVVAASVLNNAFTTTMAYDGVALISTAHPGVGNGVTFANRPAVDEDISVAALRSSTERFFNLQTDRGLRISMAPAILLVPVQSWWLAQEILGARYMSNGSQGLYTPNITQQFGLTPIKWAYLTDPDSWYVLARKGVHKLKFYWRRKPDPTKGYDGRAEVSWFGVTARFSAGVTDWRGIDGSPGF